MTLKNKGQIPLRALTSRIYWLNSPLKLGKSQHFCYNSASSRFYREVLYGQVAQSVEQRIENPRVGSSILPLATIQDFSATSLPEFSSLCLDLKFTMRKFAHFFRK